MERAGSRLAAKLASSCTFDCPSPVLGLCNNGATDVASNLLLNEGIAADELFGHQVHIPPEGHTFPSCVLWVRH